MANEALSYELELGNSSPSRLTLALVPSLRLFGPGGQFWAPFNLESPAKPLAANARAELRLSPGERRRIRIDMAALHWSSAVSSTWPTANLTDSVPAGNYSVELRLQGLAGREDAIVLPVDDVAIPAAVPPPTRVATADLVRWGKEFRSMRRASNSQADGKQWAGQLHASMSRLADTLGDGRHTEGDVRRVMGRPDEVRAVAARIQPGQRLLIYAWRGRHDYLYFVVEGHRVLEARWYFAED